MISLNEFLVKKHIKQVEHKYHPQTKDELIDIIYKLLNNDETDLNCIDTSKITDMEALFSDVKYKGLKNEKIRNIKISDWDVSNVRDMSNMFNNCQHFNADLSKWNVSKCTNMIGMFYNCLSFTGEGLENWKPAIKIDGARSMFAKCISLKSLPSWYKKYHS